MKSLLQGILAENRGEYYLPYLARLVMLETVERVLGEDGYYVADVDADSYYVRPLQLVVMFLVP